MALFGKDKPEPTANGITLEQAYRVIMAAREKALEIGVLKLLKPELELLVSI